MRKASSTKQLDITLKREGTLAGHIRASSGPFNAESLSSSYGIPIARVEQIIKNNGGSCA